MKNLKECEKEEIIKKRKKKGSFSYYEANRESPVYRFEKKNYVLKKIFHSGLMYFIQKELHPKVVIVFGSIEKGTYHKESDIDLFIQAKEKKISLKKYETILKHKIQLHFEENLDQLNKWLKENIINGEILSGRRGL